MTYTKNRNRPSDILQRGWIQGKAAARPHPETDRLISCDIDDSDACCWCLTGAVCLSSHTQTELQIEPNDFYNRYLKEAAALIESKPLLRPDDLSMSTVITQNWNDSPNRTLSEVLELALVVEKVIYNE